MRKRHRLARALMRPVRFWPYRRWLVVLLCVLPFSLDIVDTKAQEKSHQSKLLAVQGITELTRAAEELHRSGKPDEALVVLEQLVRRSETELGENHKVTASAFIVLGGLYEEQGRYPDAERSYKRGIAINDRLRRTRDSIDAGNLNNLAGLYTKQGRYAEAESLYRTSLAIIQKSNERHSSELEIVLHGLALLYSVQGRFGEAESIFDKRIANMEQVASVSPRLWGLLNNLAAAHHSQGRYVRAHELYRRSLSIALKQFGSEHPKSAAVMINLGHIYSEIGKNEDAERLYRWALDNLVKALGPDHPDTAEGLLNLGEFYSSHGRYDEAEPFLKRALGIWQRAHSENKVGRSLHSLGRLGVRQNKLDEAHDYFRRATAILSRRVLENQRDQHEFMQREGTAYYSLIGTSWELGQRDQVRQAEFMAEAFRAAQSAGQQTVGAAVTQMAARFNVSQSGLAQSVREHQDAARDRQEIERKLVGSPGTELEFAL